MSNMLEQAIADAAALREQAIKNAEQSVIEKYSKQIKEAVDQMLESDDPMAKVDEVITEAEEELNEEADAPSAALAGAEQGTTIETPPSWDSRYDDMMTSFTALVDNLPEDENGMIELDLGDLEMSDDEKEAMGDDEPTQDMPSEPESGLGDVGAESEGGDTSGGEESLDDLLGALQEGADNDEDERLAEILSILEEAESETVKFNSRNAAKGVWRHNQSREDFNADMADIEFGEESEEEESSEEDSGEDMGQVSELHETIQVLSRQNKQMEEVLTKLEQHLEESLLSNAKLLYQNRTLSDASLNERQKTKIVEAIANAESTKEAKNLFETLKTTVGSTAVTAKKGPQSLSESVNRRSNLSAMLNSRQNINESKQSADPFLEKMQKLAGIKK
jgi:hypothetical protein